MCTRCGDGRDDLQFIADLMFDDLTFVADDAGDGGADGVAGCLITVASCMRMVTESLKLCDSMYSERNTDRPIFGSSNDSCFDSILSSASKLVDSVAGSDGCGDLRRLANFKYRFRMLVACRYCFSIGSTSKCCASTSCIPETPMTFS